MTAGELEAAMRGLGIGWDPSSGGIILEDVETPYCNAVACESYARMGTDAGATPDEVALALRALLDGDRAPLVAMMALAKAGPG